MNARHFVAIFVWRGGRYVMIPAAEATCLDLAKQISMALGAGIDQISVRVLSVRDLAEHGALSFCWWKRLRERRPRRSPAVGRGSNIPRGAR